MVHKVQIVPLGCLRMNCLDRVSLRLFCLIFLIFFLLRITPFNSLKKGEHYQLRVKSELNEKKFPFAGFPWEFETDWYTINFIY